MASNTEIGKAFEYANALALKEKVSNVTIEDSPQLMTAKNAFFSLSNSQRDDMKKASLAAVNGIMKLEPTLSAPLDFIVKLNTDSEGKKGDVRDVIIEHASSGWNVGLSCKHNHHAVKHSRLSSTIDFGKEWLSLPCSDSYFERIVPLFSELERMRAESKQKGSPALWSDIQDKEGSFYVPVLDAFIDELKLLDYNNPQKVPQRLLHYLIGKHDFYKVIEEDKGRFTRIEAVNLNGSLNNAFNDIKPRTKIPLLSLPSKIYHLDYKRKAQTVSKNTVELVCDKGWEISMRIHNASSRVEPSLKFDVNLISLPSSIFSLSELWAE